MRSDIKQISISIGEEGETTEPVLFHIVETDAPKDYDGFGTITVSQYDFGDGKVKRIVLIRDEHFNWQTSRYSSGVHGWDEPEYGPPEVIVQQLWKRLAQREET